MQPAVTALAGRLKLEKVLHHDHIGLKADDFERFPALQRQILERFAPLVKSGGRLVYATCSLARAEDEAVVESFLGAHPDFALEPASAAAPAETCEGPYLRTFPHRHGTDGFFAAVLRRG